MWEEKIIQHVESLRHF